MSFHVLYLEVNGSFNLFDCELFAAWWSDALVHHLLLQEWTKLMLILGKVILLNTDFHHDLLLKWHSDLLNLSHTLGNHSKILIKILISFLFVIFFSVFFEVFREFEDFFFGCLKWECEDFFNILKCWILEIDLRFDFFDFVIKIEFWLLFLNVFYLTLFFIAIAFVETVE